MKEQSCARSLTCKRMKVVVKLVYDFKIGQEQTKRQKSTALEMDKNNTLQCSRPSPPGLLGNPQEWRPRMDVIVRESDTATAKPHA
jgi:hypothetical protein